MNARPAAKLLPSDTAYVYLEPHGRRTLRGLGESLPGFLFDL